MVTYKTKTIYKCRECGATSYQHVIGRALNGALLPTGQYRCTGCRNVFATIRAWWARCPTYNVGISFTQISKKHQDQISRMALDHGDCETRLSLKLPEVCVKPCTFHSLCAKPQKMPFWPKK